MNIHFNIPNTNYCTNLTKTNDDSILLIPFRTIKKYFFWNYENLYFLILSIFQLMTSSYINILPHEWSPTGPFSTAIPLVLCIFLEIINNSYSWCLSYYQDMISNHRQIRCLRDSQNEYDKENGSLCVGQVIHLTKNEIVPADCLLLGCKNDRYGKISLSPLNGESALHYIEPINKTFSYDDYVKTNICVKEYYPNNFYNISCELQNGSKIRDINGSSFVVSNSIVKSDDLYLWVIRCGKDKKSYYAINNNTDKTSRLDKHVSNYMISINTYLLFVLVFIVSIVKLLFLPSHNNIFYNIIFFGIQNWILFNGAIPFSIKIFLIITRGFQSYLLNKNNMIKINNPKLVDDINKIQKIITDKTGTLTKNELEFTKIFPAGSDVIIDISENDNEMIQTLDVELIKCLGLCIHQNDNDFDTVEDKIIRYRYELLNSNIMQINNNITLDIFDEKYEYNYIDIMGLDFTFNRKMSSKVVQDDKGNYFIYTKGSLDKIGLKLTNNEEIKRLDNIISKMYPDLRLLACAYRPVQKEEFRENLKNSVNNKLFVESLENNLIFLGIIGIKDNLQPFVRETIKGLEKRNIYCSMCTGDRKITALAIANECGIFDNDNDIIDVNDSNDLVNINDKKGTVLFNGHILHEIYNNDKNISVFETLLQGSKNFIAYNLNPDDKQKITSIFHKNNTNVLTTGDGFNDISMFKVSAISVAVKANPYVESCADFVINEFNELDYLLRVIGPTYYKKNALLVNYTFYRCTTVVISLVAFCMINYNLPTMSPFNGFVIQAFNFAWCTVPILYNCFRLDDLTLKNELWDISTNQSHSNLKYTTLWNIEGIITGIFVTCVTFWKYSNSENYNDLLALFLIIALNYKIIRISNDYKLIFLSFVGPILYLIYFGLFSYWNSF